MRTKTLILAVALLATCACSQKKQEMPARATDGREMFNLEVCVPVLATKATTADDSAVNSCQVFVFKEDGMLEASSYGNVDGLVLRVTRGTKLVSVLVNCTEVAGITTLGALEAHALDLSSNAPESVQMYGTKEISLTADATVEVEVTRLVARIGIDEVENAMELEQYRNLPLTVTRIFLLNVVGDRKVAAVTTPLRWYNKAAYVSSECPGLISDELGTALTYGSRMSTPHFFYCYPNASSTNTRLVVEVTVGAETWYYPITLAEVQANTSYQIEGLKITRLGTRNPDEALSLDSASFHITVKDWELSGMSAVII